MKFSVLVITLVALTNQSSCTKIGETENLALEDAEVASKRIINKKNDSDYRDRQSYSHSPVNLWYLTTLEEGLFPIIKDYVAKLGEPEFFFQRYIADYEESTLVAFNGWNSTKGMKKQFLVHRNPLWSHRMIWRFVTHFPQINDDLLSSGDPEILNAYREVVSKNSSRWPDQKDLTDSMDNLLIMHFVYDLNVTDFASGIIANVVTNASLSAIHCFEIAKYALRSQSKYTLALEWLEIAEKKRLNVNRHPILDYLEKTDVLDLLENIISEHDNVWVQEGPFHNNLFKYFDKIDSSFVLTPQKRVLQEKYRGRGFGGANLSVVDIAAFSTLCKGGNLQSEKEKSKLYCWYESKINPIWYINPQKMELYSKDPYIIQVYDFVGDGLMNYLKNISIPRIERSTVASSINSTTSWDTPSTDGNDYSNTRTSMYAWLNESYFAPRLPDLSERIGYLTGLSSSWDKVMSSNAIQVSIYATGGYFNIHVDSLGTTANFDQIVEENIGDRMATFMLYLNDVELGGKTAFTTVGVAVAPVKGSAVFWYDSKYNGEADYRTWHGGCPVLLGDKWVGNKWIHNNLNILKRKCTLNKDE